ncbi:MAG TPA: A24 family peptidase [Streptosporangiaceae bacterium]|nr:A24 family peptidase [Streptosporangiaceae bacterium]
MPDVTPNGRVPAATPDSRLPATPDGPPPATPDGRPPPTPDGPSMNWALVAGLAVAGLVTGWCLRCIVFRQAVPAGAPPATACPACGWEVRMYGRLPGPVGSPAARCPGCRARIGPPPLTVELVTAVMFGALAARVHPGLVLAAACWLAACCVALAWIDAGVRRLPDVLTVPAYAGTTGLLLLAADAGSPWPDLLRALLGGLSLAACYLALVVMTRSAIGLGDAKLAASLGTLAAWASWPALIAGSFAGFLLGAVYGAALLLSRRARLGQAIAFGPFMIAGIFLAVLASGG